MALGHRPGDSADGGKGDGPRSASSMAGLGAMVSWRRRPGVRRATSCGRWLWSACAAAGAALGTYGAAGVTPSRRSRHRYGGVEPLARANVFRGAAKSPLPRGPQAAASRARDWTAK
ncbi:hypothetical protein Ctob_002544 [Chrysochromulina tobinii]|uniref:Uncharacterized protein n=1 Tax=Chrysochromulina tobinii TaxID=1460289 RepID=A0A0M0JFA4_9EUKA|nr:hypothetical protein Ctob_002544 [Chrysochromulina tobinii]|eukprot:KOO25032.1 hypothetical protein Ctob_002544 [Chrysochromulina sp. CCMP291]